MFGFLSKLGTGRSIKADELNKRKIIDLYNLPTNNINADTVLRASFEEGRSHAETDLLAKLADHNINRANNQLEMLKVRHDYAKQMNRIETKMQRIEASTRREELNHSLQRGENAAYLDGYESTFVNTKSIFDF